MEIPCCEGPAPGSIAAARLHVKAAVDAVVALGESTAPMTLAAFEAAAWTAVMALGHALTALFLAHAAARGVRHAVGLHASVVATRFGRVPFVRPVVRDRRGRKDRPTDRAVGLRGGTSFGTLAVIARLCAQMAFGQARNLFG